MKHLLFAVITGVMAASALSGCVPLVVGGAGGGPARGGAHRP